MSDPSFLNPISIQTSIGRIAIDITQKVRENYPNIITENPVEDGSPRTDHITNLPPMVQIQGGFSDINITNLVGSILPTDALRNRSKSQIDKLLELNVKKTPFPLMDGLHYFQSMFFENLEVIKDKEGFSIFFQANIKGIRVVNLSQSSNGAFSSGQELNRAFVANANQLTVGGTVERTSLLGINILL